MEIKPVEAAAKVPIDMTPMIDIVFQLLTFFVMTLKIATSEGDFNIKMPRAALQRMMLRRCGSSCGPRRTAAARISC